MSVVEISVEQRKPEWIRSRLPGGLGYQSTADLLKKYQLHTVCSSARCPNLGECWSRKTATVMILGNICTRNCSFCAIETGKPTEYDLDEPRRVAEAVQIMGLRHAVITSVARDDLQDGGAGIWAETIRETRRMNPRTRIEVLIPDFRGREDLLQVVLEERPDILNHNVETVPRLHSSVRPQARYERSLELLARAKARGFVTKSGLMLGLGERVEEVEVTLREMAGIGLNILTLGQYLRPSTKHAPVERWVAPEEFIRWRDFGRSIGFGVVESGPLVRSSYHADEQSLELGYGR